MQDKQARWSVQNTFLQKILQKSLIDFSGYTHGMQEQCFTEQSQGYISLTGMDFSLVTKNLGLYPKLIKIHRKLSKNITGPQIRLLDSLTKLYFSGKKINTTFHILLIFRYHKRSILYIFCKADTKQLFLYNTYNMAWQIVFILLHSVDFKVFIIAFILNIKTAKSFKYHKFRSEDWK